MNLPVELQRRFDQRWAARYGVPERGSRFFVTILAGRNLSKIQQLREPEPSTVNEKTFADFTRVVEQTGIPHPKSAMTQKSEAGRSGPLATGRRANKL